MLKSLRLMFDEDKYNYKSDTTNIVSDNKRLKLQQTNGIITYSEYLLNLLKNNNEILKRYVDREHQDVDIENYINLFDDYFTE